MIASNDLTDDFLPEMHQPNRLLLQYDARARVKRHADELACLNILIGHKPVNQRQRFGDDGLFVLLAEFLHQSCNLIIAQMLQHFADEDDISLRQLVLPCCDHIQDAEINR